MASGFIDALFWISFYVFVGSTLENVEEFFNHKNMIQTTDYRVYMYMMIFALFFIIEIFATIFGAYLYKKMSKVYELYIQEEKWMEKEMKVIAI